MLQTKKNAYRCTIPHIVAHERSSKLEYTGPKSGHTAFKYWIFSSKPEDDVSRAIMVARLVLATGTTTFIQLLQTQNVEDHLDLPMLLGLVV